MQKKGLLIIVTNFVKRIDFGLYSFTDDKNVQNLN